jgi:thymidylate kinase
MTRLKMFTVALLGPDGAGKSTIGRKLEQISPLPAKYVYMGVNLESSNLVLPTTRLLLEVKRARGKRPDITVPRPHPQYTSQVRRKPAKRFPALRATLRFVHLITEEWFRQLIVWYYEFRGYYVILDRHFYFDYYAHDILNDDPHRPLYSRIHGFMLRKLYPKPDFVIFLDAPSEVLFERKPEGTLESRERRRQEYVQLQSAVKAYAVVDVSRPEEEVLHEISELIVKFYYDKNKKPYKVSSPSG